MKTLRFMLVLTLMVFALELIPLTVWLKFHLIPPQLAELIRRMQLVLVGFLCISLGFAVAARHPANSAKYLTWLRLSPWRAGLPLPLGSATPGLAEYVLLAGFVAIMTLHLHVPFEVPLIAFMLAFAVPSAITLMRTGAGVAPIAMLFVAALIPRFVADLRIVLVVAVALYAIACAAVERSLRKFPWGMDEVKFPKHALGAVFDRLSPKAPDGPVKAPDGIVIATMIGWWIYCVLAKTPANVMKPTPAVFNLAAAITGFAALMRLTTYCDAQHWPISPWGRIKTRTFIIPGYDQVFITPLCGALVGVVGPRLAIDAGMTPAVAFGLTAGSVMAVLLLGGPTLRHWKLTGSHRIALNPPKQNRPQRQPVTTVNLLQNS